MTTPATDLEELAAMLGRLSDAGQLDLTGKLSENFRNLKRSSSYITLKCTDEQAKTELEAAENAYGEAMRSLMRMNGEDILKKRLRLAQRYQLLMQLYGKYCIQSAAFESPKYLEKVMGEVNISLFASGNEAKKQKQNEFRAVPASSGQS